MAMIYASFIDYGIKLPKYQWLFNQPANKIPTQYQALIFADKTFTKKERELILEGLEDLNFICNGLVYLDITFNLEPEDEERIKHNNVLIRASTDHPAIEYADGYYEYNILGLCEYFTNDTVKLYLVPERLKSKSLFRTTTTHELGHMIGLNHTAKHSIMHRFNYNSILYPNKDDAEEIAKIWQINVDDLKYHK